jgi:hypothetical protein
MEINRETILDKTHYGLNIYAHVLQQYYPGETVLSLSGRACQPARNPFNESKPTLKIEISNNCAQHIDTENRISKGDAFDFAGLHYKLEGKQLYEKLNEALYLRIGKQSGFSISPIADPDTSPLQIQKVKSPVFSYFKAPVSNTVPYKEVSLLDVYYLLLSSKLANQTTTLRTLTDKQEARKYKASLFPYVTFSGTFSKRNDQALLRHSGLITIDFDHVDKVYELKARLLQDQYFETELLFVSPSGDGLKWVIPIDLTKSKHQHYFKAIANYLKHQYQLVVDPSGKDVSRACFLPYDADAFINPKYL